VDLGAGVGAAGLALAVRVPGVSVTLVELDPGLTEIAAANIAANGLAARARAVSLDVAATTEEFAAMGLGAGSADHVLMNPPFHDAGRQNVSPDPGRAAAHAAAPAALAVWIGAAAGLLHSAGSLTMIWRADRLAEVLLALGPEFGAITIVPIHGRAGEPAIRVVLRAAKGSRAPLALLPALNLNDQVGKPTAEAEAVLRHAQPLHLIPR